MVLNVEDLGSSAPALGLTPGVVASGIYTLSVLVTPQACSAGYRTDKNNFISRTKTLRDDGVVFLRDDESGAWVPAYKKHSTKKKKTFCQVFFGPIFS